jgi:hypothetical protein
VRTAIAIALCSLTPAIADADILYALAFGNVIDEIDTDAASATPIGSPGVSVLHMAAVSPDAIYITTPNKKLYAFDLGSARVALLDADFGRTRLAFDADAHVIYAIEGLALSTVDPVTFDKTPIAVIDRFDAEPDFVEITEFVITPGGAAIIADFANEKRFYELDLETGATEFVATTWFNDPDLMVEKGHHTIAPLRSGAFWADYILSSKGGGTIEGMGPYDPYTGDFTLVDIAGLDVQTLLRVTPSVQPACPADFNGDGNLDILDFIAFQTAFFAQDPGADCNDDVALDILDFVCFQGEFVAGCG